MTSAVRNSSKSFTDAGKQPNLMCYEIRHPTSLMEMFAVTTDNSKSLSGIWEKWNRMLNECMHNVSDNPQTMSEIRCQDVRTTKGSADVTPNG